MRSASLGATRRSTRRGRDARIKSGSGHRGAAAPRVSTRRDATIRLAARLPPDGLVPVFLCTSLRVWKLRVAAWDVR